MQITESTSLVPGLSAADLAARLKALRHSTDLGHRALAFYLADMDARRLHRELGSPTTVHYAQTHLGMSRWQARCLLDAGRALAELPAIDAAFAKRELFWSQVRLLVTVARSTTQDEWLDYARGSSYRELELACKLSQHGRPPSDNRRHLPVLRERLVLDVESQAKELFEKACAKLRAEYGQPLAPGQCLEELSAMFLQTEADGSIPGRQRVDGSYFKVVLQSEGEAATLDTAMLDTDAGLVPLGPTARGVIACDAGRLTRRERFRILWRDGLRCVHCRRAGSLTVHHRVPREEGGTHAPSNLVTLCVLCHELAHAGKLAGPPGSREERGAGARAGSRARRARAGSEARALSGPVV